ncbi:acetyl/propionyl-CoA carboxylase subuit alpha [Agromyces rhizosphaerae]|uniref:biotin carboxylase n=1 Tax=Agromyces rhizosphaerae TaxID=88374 RepID=A0A9W6CS50_9MICO|nr:biotin carboxylase N-terminal domain-containing protein [Agromyces rhizosphaerae]GLI25834.1 acetyl/propionyl-CoA carboxylase subuit alpha [Agromyces rhizosphaerae]
MTAAPFHTVLVANRGEIAVRVIRTLRRLGIRSVAVYSDADATALHVRAADDAVRIGPAAASESYLVPERIVEAALASGAQAVHPGYGFLSEHAGLARACADAGIVFVGPGERALEVMGDKIRAKRHVEASGVPVVPGVAEPGLDDDALVAAAPEVGFPLLVKPSAGGGGKGMQVVRSVDELRAELPGVRRVARAAFGDDALLLERYLERPRHIEVQVLADRHGNVIHLGERECSLQRRHQKVIEEAPSPVVDADTRRRLGDAACAAARSVDYVGAGTVEFLVSDAAPDEFFFIEMNTRLQVEHPVTELVTGVDLVEQQLRIPAGEPLALAQDDIAFDGHAIEARVYAESPERGFLPSTGDVLAYRAPSGPGVRVDSGIDEASVVTAHYDPMLAKVIAHGADRAEALDRLDRALADTVVLGVDTNIAFLRRLLADDAVRAGHLDTGLIDRMPEAEPVTPSPAALEAAARLVAARDADSRDAAVARGFASPLWSSGSGWRVGADRRRTLTFTHDGATHDVPAPVTPALDSSARPSTQTARIAAAFPHSAYSVDASSIPAAPPSTQNAGIVRAFPHSAYSVDAEGSGDGGAIAVAGGDGTIWVHADGRATELRHVGRAERLAAALAAVERGGADAAPELRAPMPGAVSAVAVADGDHVEAGADVLSVEAMKMEHRVRAPIAGVVRLAVAVGDQVRRDQVVAHVEPADAPATAETPPSAASAPIAPEPQTPATAAHQAVAAHPHEE